MGCEVYKAINGISSQYMNALLLNRPSTFKSKQELNLYIPKAKQVTFGYKSFSLIAPKIWNSLPKSIKSLDTYKKFQPDIKKLYFRGVYVITAAQNRVLNSLNQIVPITHYIRGVVITRTIIEKCKYLLSIFCYVLFYI